MRTLFRTWFIKIINQACKVTGAQIRMDQSALSCHLKALVLNKNLEESLLFLAYFKEHKNLRMTT